MTWGGSKFWIRVVALWSRVQVQVQVQVQTRGKGWWLEPQTQGKDWWLHPPTQGGDSAPPCERIEGVAEETVEEAVEEAHPKKLTATHEGVVVCA